MNDAILAVFESLVLRFKISADDILEYPEMRSLFLAETRHTIGDLPERDLLHGLSCLRKKGLLPKSRDLVSK